MAYENVITTEATVAVDRVAGLDFQAIKIDVGADGAVSGPVSAGNPMPVTAAALPLPAGAATAASQASLLTAIGLLTAAVATFAEDTPSAGGDKGIAILAVRRDANTSLVDATGDYGNLQLDANGSLKVAITAGAGSGGTSLADEAAFTPATTSFTPIGGIYNSTPDTLATGKGGAFQMTAARAQHVFMVDAAGAPVAAASPTTDGVGAFLASDKLMEGTTGLVVKTAPITASASGDTSVVALVASKKIKVVAAVVTGNGAVNIKWRSATTDITGLEYIAGAGGGSVLPFNPVGWFETAAGVALNINLSGAVGVGGFVRYIEAA